jgi:hypothetical protein
MTLRKIALFIKMYNLRTISIKTLPIMSLSIMKLGMITTNYVQVSQSSSICRMSLG